jgi:hypothetical protein
MITPDEMQAWLEHAGASPALIGALMAAAVATQALVENWDRIVAESGPAGGGDTDGR